MEKSRKEVRESANKFAGESRLELDRRGGDAAASGVGDTGSSPKASPNSPASEESNGSQTNELRGFLDTVDPSMAISGVLSADYSDAGCSPAQIASALRVVAVVAALRSETTPSAVTDQLRAKDLTIEEEATVSRIANCSSDVVRDVLDWLRTPELVRSDKVKMVRTAQTSAEGDAVSERLAESLVPWQKAADKTKGGKTGAKTAGRPSSFVRAGAGSAARRLRGAEGGAAGTNRDDPQDLDDGDLGFARPDDDLDDL